MYLFLLFSLNDRNHFCEVETAGKSERTLFKNFTKAIYLGYGNTCFQKATKHFYAINTYIIRWSFSCGMDLFIILLQQVNILCCLKCFVFSRSTPAACLVDFKWREITLFFMDTGSLQASQNSLPETTDGC